MENTFVNLDVLLSSRLKPADTLAGLTTLTNLTQMNGQAISMNTGVRDAGTQRVTIATNDIVPTSQFGTWTVQPGNTANTTPWLVVLVFSTRSDTYTGTGNGVTIDVSTRPFHVYAIQVKGTGAAPTSWDVRLEGSLDNSNFTQILQHTQAIGDGGVVWSGSSLSPALYFRSRVAGLVLGGATNIVVTILGER